MILVIDNYDSFVHNLARYIRLWGCEVNVVRNDQITAEQIQDFISQKAIVAIVMSPGPCTPDQAGVCLEVVKRFAHLIPILGICLGHQVIAQALGGKVIQWNYPVHGKADLIEHDGQAEFSGIPTPFRAARYHSLTVVERTLPSSLIVSARLADQTVMAIRHKRWPLVGYQFHPESILTEHGMQLIEGFLRIAGIVSNTASPGKSFVGHQERECDFPLGVATRTINSATTGSRE